MLHYKTPSGQVFAYATHSERERFGASDLVAITEAEVLDLAVPPTAPSPAEQIDTLERHHMLPRPVRDVMLGLMEKEAAALGLTPAQLRVANPGYRRVKELDEQIAALRALL